MASRPRSRRCPTPGWAPSSSPQQIVPTVSPNTSLRPRSSLARHPPRRASPGPRIDHPDPDIQVDRASGHYAHDKKTAGPGRARGKLFLSPYDRAKRVEVRSLGNALVVDDRLAFNRDIASKRAAFTRWRVLRKTAGSEAPGVSRSMERFDRRIRLGPRRPLHPRKERQAARPHRMVLRLPARRGQVPDQFRFPDYGLYSDESVVFHRDGRGKVKDALAASVVFTRRRLDGEDGNTFRIKPVRPRHTPSRGRSRAAARGSRPVPEAGPGRSHRSGPFDQARNPLCHREQLSGASVYKTARAFMQSAGRPRPLRAAPIARQGRLWIVDSRRLSTLAGDEDLLGRRSRIRPDLRRRSVQGVQAQPRLRG